MTYIPVPPAECPCCGDLYDRTFQRAGPPSEAQKEGDIMLCDKCGAACRLTGKLKMVVIPKKLLDRPRYKIVREIQAEIRKKRGLPV